MFESSPSIGTEDPVFAMYRGGKISVRPIVDVTDRHGLAMACTPGVARVCTAIAAASELAAEYTWHQPPHLSGRKRTLCAPGYVLR